MGEYICYTYAIARPVPGLEEIRAHGVASAGVHLVWSTGLAAAVSPVPAKDFREEALKANLEDLDWLEAVARAHHDVVETLSAQTTVLPLRLGTVYLDDTRVRQMLEARQETFTALLDRLTNHVEWGVKVYADPRMPSPASPPSQAGAASAQERPGRAYLQSRRAQRRTQEDAWAAAEEAMRRIDTQARGLAVDRARHRPQQGELARGAAGENVANDAYLVPEPVAAEFRERVLQAADGLSGVRVEVTGPWAPYSFAVPPEPREQQGADR